VPQRGQTIIDVSFVTDPDYVGVIKLEPTRTESSNHYAHITEANAHRRRDSEFRSRYVSTIVE
jgi:hypothetical protein